ncbi:MAG: tRNA (adenosine(37)-N6)-threonylcarbamoyltransferase complex ATPase subunit type 1 TsaE [Ignavibacteriaceae bacterium]
MSFPYSRVSKSEEETKLIAFEFSGLISNGMVIILNGDLGVGKTFFIKRVLEKFNVTNVNSPTFAIVNEYEGNKKFYHFDFYRINSVKELIDIGTEDYFSELDSIILIEWGNMFPEILPNNRIEINITYNDSNERVFRFVKYE